MRKIHNRSTKKGEKNGTVSRSKRLTVKSVRSALTNGRCASLEVDMRSAWARRLRDLVQAFIEDLGGVDVMSEAQLTLAKRVSMLALQLELLAMKFAEQDGTATSTQLLDYQRCVNTLRRTLSELGIRPAKRRHEKTLGALLLEHPA